MKRQLDEINILRPITILLLVIMHSFTMYSGGNSWTLPDGIERVRAYFWIQKISFASMLEMFVFISGYIFAYQIYEQKKVFTFKSLAYNKLKRLIVPSIVFSIIYLLLFGTSDRNVFMLCYQILCGVGHMWFLPMLFWCFIATYFLLKLKVRDELKLALLFCCSVISFVPLPLGMTTTMYYMFFFFLAFFVWKHRQVVIEKLVNIKSIVWLSILFVVLFIPLTLLREQIVLRLSTISTITLKAAYLCLTNLARIIYATVGLLLLYVVVLYLLKYIKVPVWLVKLNALCMGVYLFQQFVLQFIYYKTTIPQYVGEYWLPWIGFVMAVMISLILTFILHKFKLGRMLVG